ncbi:MAG: arginine--tRNA ligase, partial [Alphaproteobacteria bacterium]
VCSSDLNAALVLAKQARMKPRDLAAPIAAALRAADGVIAVDIAGPGFINVRFSDAHWSAVLAGILAAGDAFGRSELGAGRAVNVEYVSANPTGPMHVGHSRGAVFGDALAALLERVGYAVTREYYINDAGAQVDVLARSVYLRYREALGEDIGAIPEGLYPGDYLVAVGKALATRDGKQWLDADEGDWLPVCRELALDAMMAIIREDLAALGVKMDVFSSERDLIAAGRVDTVLEALEKRDLVYTGVLEPPKGKLPDDWEARPQTLFRSTAFGDDVDRPLRKADHSYTYFASDIAYHLDKFERGFPEMIDIWGADHGGYVKRMKAAVDAVTEGEGRLDVKLCQLVNLLDHGEPVKMSKRAGTFVTLREVVESVGKDVVRFIMLTRRNDAALDFDFAKVTEKSRDNPVFYVQYAHARICSVERNAAAMNGLAEPATAESLGRLMDADEVALIRMMAGWPRTLEAAAEAHEPHRLAFYLYDLASAFHGLWNRGNDDPMMRFLREDDPELSRARLALLGAVKSVIASGLATFGVTPVNEMR